MQQAKRPTERGGSEDEEVDVASRKGKEVAVALVGSGLDYMR